MQSFMVYPYSRGAICSTFRVFVFACVCACVCVVCVFCKRRHKTIGYLCNTHSDSWAMQRVGVSTPSFDSEIIRVAIIMRTSLLHNTFLKITCSASLVLDTAF